ncbi:hypothetical protein CCACVL1_14976 [Corchorus capsularis]|uniref:Uncharacterized protein n=1 Tax=Corchorus capsularis TaxID=210143 RepID=A0A1R3I4P6_COCAP|nr:hypothetical protein CCACVL1_14976 [Corchorus capsularis]
MPSQTIAADEPKEAEGFGPWMVVSRRKNRGNGNIHRDKTLNNQGNSKNVKGSGPNKGSVAGPSSHNTRRGKEVGLGQPNNTKPPTPKTKVQISTDINAVESDKRDSSPHPRALSLDTLAESSKIPSFYPIRKKFSKQKISPPKNGPSKGERNSSTSLSSGRLLLDRTRSGEVSLPPQSDNPSSRETNSDQSNLGQTNSGHLRRSNRRFSTSPHSSSDRDRNLNDRELQEPTPRRSGRPGVQGGKRNSRRRSRSPNCRSLGHTSDEKDNIYSRSPIRENNSDSKVCEGDSRYRAILHRAHHKSNGIQRSGSPSSPRGSQHDLEDDRWNGDCSS